MCKKMISTMGNKFVDPQGRHIILHGINMVCKDKDRNYIGAYTEEDFLTLKQWGFNVIRLGIFWDGVEPEPGQYDENYLSEVDHIIQLAGKYDLGVFLDMHQDLFGHIYSDGAPEWATIIDGQEHISTQLWSEAYLLSPAVQAAFDNFWDNRKASDGIGIQDHFINMWRYLASRYKENKTVIGYDILNEPFMGSEVNNLIPKLLWTMGNIISENEPVDMEKLMEQWLDPVQKLELLSQLSDKDYYLRLMREVEGIPQQFERDRLNEFYNKTGRAIREVDQDTILFLEANYFSNAGMKSGIRPVMDDNHVPVDFQAYSPHGYDLLVDTDLYHLSNNTRIDVIFDTHKSVQGDLQLPMLVGEWGCYPNATRDQLTQAAYLTEIFERFLAGDTYYDFSHVYNNQITKVLRRAYPMKAAGEILSYHYNFTDESFTAVIRENKSTFNSIIYLPDISRMDHISVIPYEKGFWIEKIEGSNSGYLIVPSSVRDIQREITFVP